MRTISDSLHSVDSKNGPYQNGPVYTTITSEVEHLRSKFGGLIHGHSESAIPTDPDVDSADFFPPFIMYRNHLELPALVLIDLSDDLPKLTNCHGRGYQPKPYGISLTREYVTKTILGYPE